MIEKKNGGETQKKKKKKRKPDRRIVKSLQTVSRVTRFFRIEKSRRTERRRGRRMSRWDFWWGSCFSADRFDLSRGSDGLRQPYFRREHALAKSRLPALSRIDAAVGPAAVSGVSSGLIVSGIAEYCPRRQRSRGKK